MRCENWDAILADYLEASKDIEFQWGVNDCALWASSFVDLITGSNHAASWRGQYSNEFEATELMTALGLPTPEAIADSILESIPVKRSMRGDLVLIHTGALGICAGRKSYFLAPEKGLVHILTISCTKAWKV